MIPKDMNKNRIKQEYLKILKEDLKESEKEFIIKSFIEKINLQNKEGMLLFKNPDQYEDAIEMIFSKNDEYIKDTDELIGCLVENDYLNLEKIQEDLEKIVEIFFNEDIESLDFDTFYDQEVPYLVYINWVK